MARQERTKQEKPTTPTSTLFSTGIEGLDEILGGGLLRGSFIMVVGQPGTGKTVLVQQLCFQWAKQNKDKNRKAVFFSTISEPHEKLIEHISKFDFFDGEMLFNQTQIISLQDAMNQGADKVAEIVVNTVRQRNCELVVIDGFRSLIAAVGGTNNAALMLAQLSSQLNFLGASLIITLEDNYERIASGELLTTSDGIISLYLHRVGSQSVRHIEVPKMRGQAQLSGLHTYEISKSGWHIYPRLEALATNNGSPDTRVVRDESQAFGVPEIDKLMTGGVPKGSLTTVAGAPSTGKTLLSLHYLSEGATHGQPGLLLSFDETRQQLIDKADRFKLSFSAGLADGTLHLHSIPPVELDVNKIGKLIREEVEQHNIQRLVIDGISAIERATKIEDRSYDYIAALINYLRIHGVTLVVTKDVPSITGVELDFGDDAMSQLSENLLLLRYAERNSKLYRTLVVLKMRDKAYDQSICEFNITDDGITVGGPAFK